MAQVGVSGRLQRVTGLVGFIALLGIGIGLGEGIAIGLQEDGSAFSLATVLGYLSFSIWMILTGISLLGKPGSPIAQPAGGYNKSTI